MPKCEIMWLDSGVVNAASDSTWHKIADLMRETKLATVKSTGYLAGEDEDAYYLIQTYDPQDAMGLNLIAIAKQNVKQFTYLEITLPDYSLPKTTLYQPKDEE